MGRVVMRDVQTTQTTYQQQEQVSTVQVPVQRQVPRTVQERSTSFATQCVQEEVMVQGPTQYRSQTHCPPPVCTTSCAPVATACAQPVVRTASYGCGVPAVSY